MWHAGSRNSVSVGRCRITPYYFVVVSATLTIPSVFFLSLLQLPEPPRIRLTLCLTFVDRERVTTANTTPSLYHSLPSHEILYHSIYPFFRSHNVSSKKKRQHGLRHRPSPHHISRHPRSRRARLLRFRCLPVLRRRA